MPLYEYHCQPCELTFENPDPHTQRPTILPALQLERCDQAAQRARHGPHEFGPRRCVAHKFGTKRWLAVVWMRPAPVRRGRLCRTGLAGTALRNGPGITSRKAAFPE